MVQEIIITFVKCVEKAIVNANNRYKEEVDYKQKYALSTSIPLTELCILAFNLKDLKMTGKRTQATSVSNFTTSLTPMVDLFSILCGIEELKVGIINKATNLAMEKEIQGGAKEGT